MASGGARPRNPAHNVSPATLACRLRPASVARLIRATVLHVPAHRKSRNSSPPVAAAAPLSRARRCRWGVRRRCEEAVSWRTEAGLGARGRGRRRGRRGCARGQGRGAGARRHHRPAPKSCQARREAQAAKANNEATLGGVRRRRLDHDLQLGRVRHLQAQPQPRQVAPVHHRHGYLRRGDRERRAHRPARLSRGSVAQEHRHGQAPGVQAVQRDGELARHHGPDDRAQPAADARRARPAGHLLLHQRRRPRQHGLSRALGQQVAAAAGELLVLPAGGRQAAVLPPARDFIDLGGDYTLYNQHNQAIGTLDGKVFSIGGKWKGRVKTSTPIPAC